MLLTTFTGGNRSLPHTPESFALGGLLSLFTGRAVSRLGCLHELPAHICSLFLCLPGSVPWKPDLLRQRHLVSLWFSQ